MEDGGSFCLVPVSSIFNPRSSTPSSTVALAADHVDHTEGRDNIRNHVTFDHLVKGAHGDETRRAHSDAIGFAPAVAYNIEAKFSVASFHGEIDFTGRHLDSFHNDFEMMHQPFDAVIDLFFFRQHEARIVDPNGTHRNFLPRLIDNPHALLDFLDAADESIIII